MPNCGILVVADHKRLNPDQINCLDCKNLWDKHWCPVQGAVVDNTLFCELINSNSGKVLNFPAFHTVRLHGQEHLFMRELDAKFDATYWFIDGYGNKCSTATKWRGYVYMTRDIDVVPTIYVVSRINGIVDHEFRRFDSEQELDAYIAEQNVAQERLDQYRSNNPIIC